MSLLWAGAMVLQVGCGDSGSKSSSTVAPDEGHDEETELEHLHLDLPWTAEDEASLAELKTAFREAVETKRYVPADNIRAEPLDARTRPFALEIHVFSIGQADSLLVVGPSGRTLLVDLGNRLNGETPPGFESSRAHVLQRLEEITGGTHVDYFLVSHYHADHVGKIGSASSNWGSGIIGLLSDYSVQFSVGEFIHIGDTGAEFLTQVENARGSLVAIRKQMPLWMEYGRVVSEAPPVFGPDQIDLGPGVSVDVLSYAGLTPDGNSAFTRAVDAGADYEESPGSENDLSIALLIRVGEFEFFTGGDLNGTQDPVGKPYYTKRDFGDRSEIYTNVEHHLVGWLEQETRDLDVEVFRANHHGSEYSNTQKLLNVLDPEFVIYSTGAGYGHPKEDVVERSGETARQFATTAVTNGSDFANHRGELADDIAILVESGGVRYSIESESFPAFSDEAELVGEDEGAEDNPL